MALLLVRRVCKIGHLPALAMRTSPCLKQTKATNNDPVQRQFVDKIRLYCEKLSSTGDGQLVDASPRIKEELAEELGRLGRIYNLSEDKLTFPTFTFAEPKYAVINLADENKAMEEEVKLKTLDEMTERERQRDNVDDWMTMPLETNGYSLQMFADDGVNYQEPTVKEIVENDYLLCDAEDEELYDDDKIVYFKHLPEPEVMPEVRNVTSDQAKRFPLRF